MTHHHHHSCPYCDFAPPPPPMPIPGRVLFQLDRIADALEEIARNTRPVPVPPPARIVAWFGGTPVDENRPLTPIDWTIPMPAQVTMTNRQHVSAALALVDADGQPIVGLPEGGTVIFSSSDPEIAEFTPSSGALTGDISSGLTGTCRITGTVTLEDGVQLADFVDVRVTSSEPTTATFSVGTPEQEALRRGTRR